MYGIYMKGEAMLSSKLKRGTMVGAVMALMLSLMAVLGTNVEQADAGGYNLKFNMVPSSAAIKSCLPKASAEVKVSGVKNNQRLTLEVYGLAPDTDYDFFITQVPHAKFGISWYQSDLHTNRKGEGEATVRGIFSEETFTISPDTITTKGRENQNQTGATFGAVNMYHLGLWFNDPQVPFNLGCEPHGPNDKPVVTPFNGEQHAGIQVLNTSNFDDNAGPLKKFKP